MYYKLHTMDMDDTVIIMQEEDIDFTLIKIYRFTMV